MFEILLPIMHGQGTEECSTKNYLNHELISSCSSEKPREKLTKQAFNANLLLYCSLITARGK